MAATASVSKIASQLDAEVNEIVQRCSDGQQRSIEDRRICTMAGLSDEEFDKRVANEKRRRFAKANWRGIDSFREGQKQVAIKQSMTEEKCEEIRTKIAAAKKNVEQLESELAAAQKEFQDFAREHGSQQHTLSVLRSLTPDWVRAQARQMRVKAQDEIGSRIAEKRNRIKHLMRVLTDRSDAARMMDYLLTLPDAHDATEVLREAKKFGPRQATKSKKWLSHCDDLQTEVDSLNSDISTLEEQLSQREHEVEKFLDEHI